MEAQMKPAWTSPDLIPGARTCTRRSPPRREWAWTLLSLVLLRASQINGCACASTPASRARGRSARRTNGCHQVVAWRETPYFTDDERAALELTEAVTRLQDGAAGVTDHIWYAAADQFSQEQLSAIILEIALTNFFNRINRTINEQAGKTW